MSNYKILFLGQKNIGEACFDILSNSSFENFEIVAAVSNESDQNWWKSCKIYNFCINNNIEFISNSTRNNQKILDIIESKKVNLIVSVQHPWILPESIINKVKNKAYNLHNAKLPDYRGNNSCNHAILNNEKEYTCTIHLIDKEVDMGDIVFEEIFPITSNETAKSLYEKAFHHGEKVFKKFINALLNNIPFDLKKIKSEGQFYMRNSIDEYKKIQKFDNVSDVEIKIRACYFPPFEIAYIILDDYKFYIAPIDGKDYIENETNCIKTRIDYFWFLNNYIEVDIFMQDKVNIISEQIILKLNNNFYLLLPSNFDMKLLLQENLN